MSDDTQTKLMAAIVAARAALRDTERNLLKATIALELSKPYLDVQKLKNDRKLHQRSLEAALEEVDDFYQPALMTMVPSEAESQE
jgi:hypothetical protein